MAFGDVVFSQRSVRRYKPDPIPMEDLHLIMEAAVRAPNGGNSQPARFVLLTDRRVIEQMGALYREAWWAKRRGAGWKSMADIPAEDRIARSAARLADNMKDVPAIVLAFGRISPMGGGVDASSVIPTVQNLMLAARALGIATLPTTLHPDVMDRVYELLGVPAEASFHLLVPLGYPVSERAFGLSRRLPTSETTYHNRWGENAPWDD
jgi:nitroreductase